MLQPNVEGGTDFVVARGGRPMGRVCLPMPGVHNVLNALGVIATAGTITLTLDALVSSGCIRKALFAAVAQQRCIRQGLLHTTQEKNQ